MRGARPSGEREGGGCWEKVESGDANTVAAKDSAYKEEQIREVMVGRRDGLQPNPADNAALFVLV